MPSIIVANGPNQGDYYPIDTETVVVGRDSKCPIQVVDEKLSRVHLQIRYDKTADQYLAKDLKSANGVIINGRKIADDEAPLANGDLLEVGDTKLMFLTMQFADRKSAWSAYKMAGERGRATMIQAPDPPERKGWFGKGR